MESREGPEVTEVRFMESRGGPDMTEVRVLVNLARFGSRNGILTKFINDSASFLLEKLKNH